MRDRVGKRVDRVTETKGAELGGKGKTKTKRNQARNMYVVCTCTDRKVREEVEDGGIEYVRLQHSRATHLNKGQGVPPLHFRIPLKSHCPDAQ